MALPFSRRSPAYLFYYIKFIKRINWTSFCGLCWKMSNQKKKRKWCCAFLQMACASSSFRWRCPLYMEHTLESKCSKWQRSKEQQKNGVENFIINIWYYECNMAKGLKCKSFWVYTCLNSTLLDRRALTTGDGADREHTSAAKKEENEMQRPKG